MRSFFIMSFGNQLRMYAEQKPGFGCRRAIEKGNNEQSYSCLRSSTTNKRLEKNYLWEEDVEFMMKQWHTFLQKAPGEM